MSEEPNTADVTYVILSRAAERRDAALAEARRWNQFIADYKKLGAQDYTPPPPTGPEEIAMEMRLAVAPSAEEVYRAPTIGRMHQMVDVAGIRILPSLTDRWTEERMALIRRDYPTVRLTSDILADVNALPGGPVTYQQLMNFVSQKLHLKRQGLPMALEHTKMAQPPMLPPIGSPEPAEEADVKFADQCAIAPANSEPEVMPPGIVRPTMDEMVAEGPAPIVIVPAGPKPEPEAPIIEAKAPSKAPAAPSSPSFEPVKVPVVATIVAPAPPPAKRPTPPPVVKPDLGPPRLAKALELPTPLPPTSEPIEADAATIRATVSAWGMGFRGEIDLPAVNSAAFRRGSRPFKLIETPASSKKRCLKCRVRFEPKHPANHLCPNCSPRGQLSENYGA